MPRPIRLTEKLKQKAREEFDAMLDTAKIQDGELHYRKCFKYKERTATVLLTPEAYSKTMALVIGFPDEVGWHGIVTRAGDDTFIIEDIIVYPQEVTGSEVVTDQEEYGKWLYGLDDEAFPKLRLHGHSHVNMGVSPSVVDDKHRQGLIDQLEGDMFYIFMIWNKALSVHTLVYDMARNILFEDEDVTVQLLENAEMDEFIADAKEKVQKKSNAAKKSNPGTKNLAAKQTELGDDADADRDSLQSLYGLYDPFDLGGASWRS
jgi:hypothetical protein